MSTATDHGQSATNTAEEPAAHVVRNGVDTTALFATLDAVKGDPEIARFQFRATNRWVSGTHSRSSIQGFYGAKAEDTTRTSPFVLDADHPTVLCGDGQGPTPVEFLLHALAACLTAGLVNIAAARGITLTSVESSVTGDINLLGILGLSDEVRNGYERMRVDFRISGDAPAEKLAALVERSRARSAVFDVITNSVPVEINVTTA